MEQIKNCSSDKLFVGAAMNFLVQESAIISIELCYWIVQNAVEAHFLSVENPLHFVNSTKTESVLLSVSVDLILEMSKI